MPRFYTDYRVDDVMFADDEGDDVDSLHVAKDYARKGLLQVASSRVAHGHSVQITATIRTPAGASHVLHVDVTCNLAE